MAKRREQTQDDQPEKQQRQSKRRRRRPGEGTVYQRKDGRYVAEITLEDGSRKSYYFKTEKEALEKKNELLYEKRQGILATGPHQKLATYLTTWLETTHKPPAAKPQTYSNYRTVINKHLISTIGHIVIQKLTPQRVQTLYAQKLHEGLAPRTVGLIHGVLHMALDNAVRWNIVSRNVTDLVDLPHAEKYDAQTLDVEQARTLLEVAKDSLIETLLLVAVTTGMRRGELLALRWSDIDFKHKVLYVRHSVGRVAGYGYVEGDPKSKTSRRKIMLPDAVLKSLNAQRERQDQIKQKAGDQWQEHDLVFTNRHGRYMHFDMLMVRFHKLTDAAGLPRIRLHDLRHSAATILLAKGVHPKVVQELLEHSSIRVTMDIYSHVLPSMQKEASQTMDSLFSEEG